MSKKLLIIKTGHSEVFTENRPSSIVSLGDVLRTSFILDFFSQYHITWLTSEEATPLLRSNGKINELQTNIKDITDKTYDLLINLEKDQSYNFFRNVSNDYYGFFYDGASLKVKIPDRDSIDFFNFLDDVKHESSSFQLKLSYLLGKAWNKGVYKVDNSLRLSAGKTIGLNWKTGSKWPEKQLPKSFWTELSIELSSKSKISFQQGFNDLDQYINWINTCDQIITLDSLGLHIALSLGKPTIALFGPTNHHHIEMYNLGHKLCYNINDLNTLKHKIINLIQNIE